jgi:hypothetical protein
MSGRREISRRPFSSLISLGSSASNHLRPVLVRAKERGGAVGELAARGLHAARWQSLAIRDAYNGLTLYAEESAGPGPSFDIEARVITAQ